MDWKTAKKKWLEMGYDEQSWPHREVFVKRILKLKPKTVLDIGCGHGPDIALLEMFGVDCEGVDLIGVDVLLAQKRGLNVKLGDALNLEYKAKSFDVVISDGVLMYLAPKVPEVQKKMERIAKIGVVALERANLNWPKVYKITAEDWPTDPTWQTEGYIYEKLK